MSFESFASQNLEMQTQNQDAIREAANAQSSFNPDARIEQQEITPSSIDSFNPDDRIESCDLSKSDEVLKNDFDPDKRIESESKSEVVSDVELYNPPEKRKQKALESKGEWKDEPGRSEFVPESKEAREELDKHGVDSISYDDNYEPDFSPVSEETVEIDNMNEERLGPGGNYEQAFEKLAQKFNEEARDGKTDWTSRDVDKWRQDNKLTPHERMDRKTVDFVPSSIHKECKHCGGVSECKTKERIGGGFDA